MYYVLIAWKYIRIATLYKTIEYIVVSIGELNLKLAHLEVHEWHPSKKNWISVSLNGSGNEERANRKKKIKVDF